MDTASSSRIWTRAAVFIFYDYNHYNISIYFEAVQLVGMTVKKAYVYSVSTLGVMSAASFETYLPGGVKLDSMTFSNSSATGTGQSIQPLTL